MSGPAIESGDKASTLGSGEDPFHYRMSFVNTSRNLASVIGLLIILSTPTGF